jgi:hypothetical protein
MVYTTKIVDEHIADMEAQARYGDKVLWELTVNEVVYGCEFGDNTNTWFVYVNDELATQVAYLIDGKSKIRDPFEMREDEFDDVHGWKIVTETGGYSYVEDIGSIEVRFETAIGAV